MLVMLEKLANNAKAQKLQTILLLEVDFNAMHKINRLILSIEVTDAIPAEAIGGRSSQVVTHLLLEKKLASGIVNTMKLLAIPIYADATHYYDRVAYLFVSLCTQCFRLEITCLVVLFRAIQSMKMFL